MKTIKEISSGITPFVAIDKRLDKLRDEIRFTKKLEKANEMLATVSLPKKK